MKFTVDLDGWRGETFEDVDPDDYTYAECAALERVTGYSIVEIEDPKGRPRGMADVLAGRIWIAVRRARPNTPFTEVQGWPLRAARYELDEPEETPEPVEEAGPTVSADPDGAATPESPPSEPSG